jgi:hypothetical protein
MVGTSVPWWGRAVLLFYMIMQRITDMRAGGLRAQRAHTWQRDLHDPWHDGDKVKRTTT